jgi:hypothetical protein
MAKSNKNNASGAATEQINAVLEASKTPPEGSKMPPNGSENGSQAGLRVEYRPLEALIPFASNPRAHSDEQVAQIAASIREFGFTNPILLDGENGVIAGHGRLAAARLLGLKMVPCIELGHLSEAQKRAYIIADNKLALNGLWNEELLCKCSANRGRPERGKQILGSCKPLILLVELAGIEAATS